MKEDGEFVVEGGIAKSTSLRELCRRELPPGATVLFKRGCVWRGQLRVRSGVPGHPVTYGAWGEGPDPVIEPSLDRGSPDAWSREPDASSDTVFLYISYLRRKLKAIASTSHIEGDSESGFFLRKTE